MPQVRMQMVDDEYDGGNFVVRQVFFCGDDRKEFQKWQKGLENLAADGARKRAAECTKVLTVGDCHASQ